MEYFAPGNVFVCGKVANVLDEVAIREHFQNLCAKVGVRCKEHLARALAATQTRDWFVACSEWRSCKKIIVGSGLSDRGDWLWLSGCLALVWANLWSFYSINLGRALKDAIAAFKAYAKLQSVSEAPDFGIHVLPTLWMAVYLWASTSDCKEEALEPDVKFFLINHLLRPRDSISDSDARTLKQQCEEFVMNKFKYVVWKVQMHYFGYSKTKECLRWAREGNKLYKERYSGKMDYISKYNEGFTLFTSGAFERAKEVCEAIISELDLEPLKGKAMDGHPAAQYCDPQYEFEIHSMLGRCYEQMAVQSGRGKTRTDKLFQLANKETEKCESLLGESELQEEISLALKCRADALEDAANNKYGVSMPYVHPALGYL